MIPLAPLMKQDRFDADINFRDNLFNVIQQLRADMRGVIGEFHHKTMSVLFYVKSEMILARAGDESAMQTLDAALIFHGLSG